MGSLHQILLFATTSASLVFAGSIVQVEGKAGAYQLVKDGKPYFVMGAGGDGPKDLLKALGGNSFRTWGSDDAAKQLDEAQKQGLTVTIGHWLGHQAHGFNYGDPAALARQKEDVRKTVLKHKDHPALLMWALGNEMEMNCSNEEAMWNHINDLALMVKSLDPQHPVMTVIAEIPDAKVQSLLRLCPAIDIVGINTYGGAASIPERWRKAGGTKPYIITEFGPPGQWEVKKNAFGCPPELTSTEKGKFYADVYRKVTTEDKVCSADTRAHRTWTPRSTGSARSIRQVRARATPIVMARPICSQPARRSRRVALFPAVNILEFMAISLLTRFVMAGAPCAAATGGSLPE